MKRMRMTVLICTLLFGVALSGTAFSAGPDGGRNPMGAHRGHHGKGGPMFLTESVQKNLMVQSLAQLTGKPAVSIGQELREKPFPEVLREYKIDPKALHTVVQEKANALVKLLTDNGYLTPEQSRLYFQGMEKRAERHEILNRLVEKGVKDGTVTAEQAELLRPKHL
jgi:polyhydroxyalkanoate synthesis regulator phasin